MFCAAKAAAAPSMAARASRMRRNSSGACSRTIHPRERWTRPSCVSLSSASRTGVRLTRSQLPSSSSTRRMFGRSSPLRMASRSLSCTVSAATDTVSGSGENLSGFVTAGPFWPDQACMRAGDDGCWSAPRTLLVVVSVVLVAGGAAVAVFATVCWSLGGDGFDEVGVAIIRRGEIGEIDCLALAVDDLGLAQDDRECLVAGDFGDHAGDLAVAVENLDELAGLHVVLGGTLDQVLGELVLADLDALCLHDGVEQDLAAERLLAGLGDLGAVGVVLDRKSVV